MMAIRNSNRKGNAVLTKDDIHAIRRANDICVHLGKRHQTGLVRLIKRKGYDAKPFDTDQEYVLDNVHVTMETSLGKTALDSGAAECFAMAGIYHDQHTPISNVLKTLRVGDDLTFSFHPDGHCNGYVAAAGLHADVLYLDVRRDGKRLRWELATSICPSNSARMCHGVPSSESYERDADRVRKMA
jgi:hypothetical protein